MSGFTPFKKHANKFNYLPRYYDPEKEERRTQRRAELRGETGRGCRATSISPGQYIRTHSHARRVPRRREADVAAGVRSGVCRMMAASRASLVLLLFIVVDLSQVDVDDAAGCGASCPGMRLNRELPPPTSRSSGISDVESAIRSRSSLTITRSDRSVWPTESNYCPRSLPTRSPQARWSTVRRRW